jgi:hypothetical protein
MLKSVPKRQKFDSDQMWTLGHLSKTTSYKTLCALESFSNHFFFNDSSSENGSCAPAVMCLPSKV